MCIMYLFLYLRPECPDRNKIQVGCGKVVTFISFGLLSIPLCIKNNVQVGMDLQKGSNERS